MKIWSTSSKEKIEDFRADKELALLLANLVVMMEPKMRDKVEAEPSTSLKILVIPNRKRRLAWEALQAEPTKKP